MPDTDIAGATITDVSSAITPFSIDSEVTEGAGASGELRYQNSTWSKDYGYYLNVPEFKTAVDAKATWTIGAGYTADEVTSMLLMGIRGNGKDSFNSILRNMIKVKTITGDAFCEIIREDGVLVNLKPLDPSTIVIVQDKMGRIKRYEQVEKASGKVLVTFEPDELLHLSHDRMADEVKGTRILASLEWLINARNEAMDDWRVMLRRNVKPMRIWYVDTDDESEIAAFKTKVDSTHANTENLIVPKGTVETEIASVAPNQTLNPLTWIAQCGDMFFQAVNVPQIIVGNAKEFTDASSKIVYLAYEQSVKAEQLYVEEQILQQLLLEIELTFPASLQNELISSENKQPDLQASQPSDTTAEVEGRN